jgi:hypothetical protein
MTELLTNLLMGWERILCQILHHESDIHFMKYLCYCCMSASFLLGQ